MVGIHVIYIAKKIAESQCFTFSFCFIDLSQCKFVREETIRVLLTVKCENY